MVCDLLSCVYSSHSRTVAKRHDASVPVRLLTKFNHCMDQGQIFMGRYILNHIPDHFFSAFSLCVFLNMLPYGGRKQGAQ